MYMIVCAHLFIYITYDMSGPFIFYYAYIFMDICAYNVFRMYIYGSSTPNISGYPQASSSSVAAQVLTVFTVRKARLNFWSVCPLPALYCAPQMHWLPTWRNHCSRPQKISQNFIKECIRGLPVLLGLQGPWGDVVCSACMVGVNVKDGWNLNVSWRFLYGRDSATMPLAQLRTQTMCVKNLRISWTGAYFLGVVKNHTGIVKPVRSTLLACEFLFWKAPSPDQKKQFILRGQKPVRTVSWQDETERYIRLRPGAFVLRTWNAFVSFLLGYAWLVLLLESNQVETCNGTACCMLLADLSEEAAPEFLGPKDAELFAGSNFEIVSWPADHLTCHCCSGSRIWARKKPTVLIAPRLYRCSDGQCLGLPELLDFSKGWAL